MVVQYDEVVIEHLPVDSGDVVSAATIVVAGMNAGWEPRQMQNVVIEGTGADPKHAAVSFIPLPAVHTYESPQHAIYRAARAFELTDYLEPFLAPSPQILAEVALSTNNADYNASEPEFLDGDRDTFVQNSNASSDFRITFTIGPESAFAQKTIGFLLRYQGNLTGPAFAFARHTREEVSPNLGHWLNFEYLMPHTNNEIAEKYAVALPDIRFFPLNNPDPDTVPSWTTVVQLIISAAALEAAGDIKVFSFYPLVLDTDLLERIAKANIRLPAQKPQRVTVPHYVAPGPELTIQGYPGGDYTAPVAQLEYVNSPEEGFRTIISLEQAAPRDMDDAGEGMRALSSELSRRSNRDTYSVRMGSRA